MGPLLWIYTNLVQIGYEQTAQKIINLPGYYQSYIATHSLAVFIFLILSLMAFLISMYVRSEGLRHINLATKLKHQSFAAKIQSKNR